jgi:hypothetical protein
MQAGNWGSMVVDLCVMSGANVSVGHGQAFPGYGFLLIVIAPTLVFTLMCCRADLGKSCLPSLTHILQLGSVEGRRLSR